MYWLNMTMYCFDPRFTQGRPTKVLAAKLNKAFQSTPHTGAAIFPEISFHSIVVSIHAPRRGDTDILELRNLYEEFQSTPHAGATLKANRGADGRNSFQSTPHAGATRLSGEQAALWLNGFNLRPTQGRHQFSGCHYGLAIVSIHAPHRGDTMSCQK